MGFNFKIQCETKNVRQNKIKSENEYIKII